MTFMAERVRKLPALQCLAGEKLLRQLHERTSALSAFLWPPLVTV